MSSLNTAHVSRCGRTYRCRKRKQTSNSKHIVYRSPELIAFCKWIKTKGFSFRVNELLPAVFQVSGRGLMTKAALKPGDVIISVPGDLLISTNVVLQSDIGNQIKRWTPKLSSQQALTIYLVWERNKGRQSNWYHYFCVLPKDFTTPTYLNDDIMSFLPRRLLKRTEVHILNIKEIFRDILSFCESNWKDMGNILTFEIFCWAWYCVNSRGVYYKSKQCDCLLDDGNNIALAPYLDLFNHSVTAQVEAGYNDVKDCYEIRTLNSYNKYDEVFISYGPHDNHRLFVEYGFVLEDNPHDIFEFDFDYMLEEVSKKKLEYLEKKLHILRSNDLLNSKLSCTLEGLSWNLLVVLRILSANWSELLNWKKVLQGEIISDQNENQVKDFAKELIQNALTDTTDLLNKFNRKYPKCSGYLEKMVHQLLDIDRNILQTTKDML